MNRCRAVLGTCTWLHLYRSIVYKILKNRNFSLFHTCIHESGKCSHCGSLIIHRVTLHIHRNIAYAVFYARSHAGSGNHTSICCSCCREGKFAGITFWGTHGEVLYCGAIKDTEESEDFSFSFQVSHHLEVSDAVSLSVECTLECCTFICCSMLGITRSSSVEYTVSDRSPYGYILHIDVIHQNDLHKLSSCSCIHISCKLHKLVSSPDLDLITLGLLKEYRTENCVLCKIVCKGNHIAALESFRESHCDDLLLTVDHGTYSFCLSDGNHCSLCI